MARVPLYKAAETEMIRRIRSGEWEAGRRLPNEFVLAEEFRVSQGTMRRALMSLEGMGLLNRKPGRGTLVSDHTASSERAGPHLMTLHGSDGSPLALEVLRARAATRGATPAEADLFGCARLATLERTFRRGGTRIALEEVTTPEVLIPMLAEDAATDLGELLQDAGCAAAAITDRLGARITSMGESVALACDRYTALLVLTHTAHDGDDRPIARQTLRVIADGFEYGPA
jgi:GntR family transcriptional regulator